MRIATWNMKQVAPRKPLEERWRWIEDEIAPDVIALTEAKVPDGGPPPGWTTIWVPGGMGKSRRWGTVLAARDVDLVEVTEIQKRRSVVPLVTTWPGAVKVADVLVGGERWATVVGLYGVTRTLDDTNCGHGRYSVPHLLGELKALFKSSRRDRIIVAGDFNLSPSDMPSIVNGFGLADLVELTAGDRPALEGCRGCNLGTRCGHFWTHRNGNSPNAAVQHIDFILATDELCSELTRMTGGIGDFPNAWSVSDHAPVVADFG